MATEKTIDLEEHNRIVKELEAQRRDDVDREFAVGYRHGWNACLQKGAK